MRFSNQYLIIGVLVLTTLFLSCEDVVTEFDCGDVETEITELRSVFGSYNATTFSNRSVTNFENAAIAIYIDEYRMITQTETSCFAFTAIPKVIDDIRITSSSKIIVGGVESLPGEALNGLFKVHNNESTYTISEFVTTHNNEPLIFHAEGDEIVLQLINKPDEAINQSFEMQLTFDDLQILNVEIPLFEVTN